MKKRTKRAKRATQSIAAAAAAEDLTGIVSVSYAGLEPGVPCPEHATTGVVLLAAVNGRDVSWTCSHGGGTSHLVFERKKGEVGP